MPVPVEGIGRNIRERAARAVLEKDDYYTTTAAVVGKPGYQLVELRCHGDDCDIAVQLGETSLQVLVDLVRRAGWKVV